MDLCLAGAIYPRSARSPAYFLHRENKSTAFGYNVGIGDTVIS